MNHSSSGGVFAPVTQGHELESRPLSLNYLTSMISFLSILSPTVHLPSKQDSDMKCTSKTPRNCQETIPIVSSLFGPYATRFGARSLRAKFVRFIKLHCAPTKTQFLRNAPFSSLRSHM